MSRGNSYKHMIKDAFTTFIDAMWSEQKLRDEKLECDPFNLLIYKQSAQQSRNMQAV